MTISAGHLATLLRPGLERMFNLVYLGYDCERLPRPSAEWMESYRRELRARQWDTWLSKHKPTVRARLERLNPEPPAEGAVIRGWHPRKADWFTRDIVPEKKYWERWNQAPPQHARSNIGRQKFVTGLQYARGP